MGLKDYGILLGFINIYYFYKTAIASISITASFGNFATWTQDLAGGLDLK